MLFFSYKEITQQIVRETYRNADQYKKAQGIFFSFRSFVRSWTLGRTNKIYRLSVCNDRHCQGGREGRRGREISVMAFANVITVEIFELICTYLHFTGTSSVPTYQGTSKFFQNLSFFMSFEQKISIPVTGKPKLMQA